ncbi:MAG: hypothetical protein ACPLKQ_06215 [Candidatus Bathyarchaeales archaeon]
MPKTYSLVGERQEVKEAGEKIMEVKNNYFIAVLKSSCENELDAEFCRILLEAVDAALDMLGASIKEALYFHLETTFALKKEAIPANPAKLSDSLERIFGLGAKFIEKIILEAVCTKTKCTLPENWDKDRFAENIEKIKMNYIQNKVIENR